ncbi:MAG: HupE/UreJ family protein, partial [Deltaproteobacteria bacterium]|nr:HupE/UreJ family protein [Deltaproteobacteria bacterium]
VGNGVHGAFLLSLLLLGGLGIAIRLATAFSAGQLVAVVLVAFSGIRVGAPLAEIGVAVAAALLAREALRAPAERRQLVALAAGAGLVHGLGIAHWAAPAAQDGVASVAFLLVSVLGMDAVLLLSATALWGLGRLVPRRLSEAPARSVAAYGVAGVALALALSAPVAEPGAAAGERPGGLRLEGLSIPEGGAGPAGSRRVASRFPDAALQSFVAVAAFEVRHEVLVRLKDVADRIGLGASGELAVEEQDDVKRRVRELVAMRTSVEIDAERAEPVAYRVDFLGLDPQGALPRLSPIREPIDAAWLGVTAVYLTAATPREVAVRWQSFDAEEAIPATVTDPETSRSVELTARRPVLRWENELTEDPAPIVTAIEVEPATVWLPVWSLLPLGGVVFFGLAVLRDRRRELSLALVRVMLVCALVLGPVAGIAMALPFSVGSLPGPVQARRILTGVLPNVYRAFEFPTESAVYDRLALSVTGETLSEVYLEHRRAVRMEERGGAKARVEAVEVLEVASVEPGDAGGFVADAAWTVGGTVTHFGHRHFRQNRYDARVVIVPVEGYWKIRSIEVLNEERLR